MDELALRTLLNSLETCRSSLHVLLHVFTWFVVFGLGFDLFVIIREFRDDWKEFRYGEIHPYENHLPKRPSVSLLILGLLGTALIVIGVAGELYVDVQAGKIETQIREANDKLLGLIIQEAGDAKASARGAKESAKEVGEQAAILEATVKRLIWQGPRDILLFDAEKSFNSLRKFSGQKFRFSVCRPDLNLIFGDLDLTEIGRTEQAIFVLLRDREWSEIVPQGLPPEPPFPYIITDSCASAGVSTSISDSATKATRDAAIALQSLLNRALSDAVNLGNGKVVLLSNTPPPDVIDIHVGLHPAKPVATKHK